MILSILAFLCWHFHLVQGFRVCFDFEPINNMTKIHMYELDSLKDWLQEDVHKQLSEKNMEI